MSEKKISRRDFIKTASGLVALLSGGIGIVSCNGSNSNIKRKGDLIILPDHGEVIVASDFHAKYDVFENWLKQTNLVKRIRNEDVYGLVLGDVVSIKKDDPPLDKDGDSRILDKIIEIQENKYGKKFILLKGNHESFSAKVYQEKRINQRNQEKKVEELYAKEVTYYDKFFADLEHGQTIPDGEYYKAFNFIERMTEEHFKYLKKLPVAAISKNGIVFTHAGPSLVEKNLVDIAKGIDESDDGILWGRPKCKIDDGVPYTVEDIKEFLKRMNNSSLLVSGHTPVDWLHNYDPKKVAGFVGGQQVIIATGYGAEEDKKSYLVLDLSKRYEGVKDLAVGKEIQVLKK